MSEIGEIFTTIKKFKMHLNLANGTFDVSSGIFLGFMIYQRGIDVNLEEIQAMISMRPSGSIKEVQQLISRIVELS